MIYALFFDETAQLATKVKNGNWNKWNSNSVHSCVAIAYGDFVAKIMYHYERSSVRHVWTELWNEDEPKFYVLLTVHPDIIV
jgi:hypothetical protein